MSLRGFNNIKRLAATLAAPLLALPLLFFHSISDASDIVRVRDIRYWSSDGNTRVVVYLSQSVEFTKNRLAGPDRLYFDLKNARISKEIKSVISDGILKGIRAGQYSRDTVRVVLDLETVENFNVFFFDDPVRLVIDVNAKKSGLISAKRVVVIDPGHGGHDPGAIGRHGLKEKDVVLDIALKVKDLLASDPSLDVHLTRGEDIFIPLEERTAIARKKNADLFVSIHANASPGRSARGVETYLLNWTNDEQAIRVAARENAISVRRMKEKMKGYKNDLDTILSDLGRQYRRDESLALAHYVQDSIVSDIGKISEHVNNLGVKQALFYVLVGASMPAILTEVSFISNPREENLLSSGSFRATIAGSIAAGIKSYFTSTPPLQKMAGSGAPGSMRE